MADTPDLARVLTETNRATFQGLVPDHCLASPTLQESDQYWQRFLNERIEENQFLLVLENEVDQVVGYVLAGGSTEKPDEAELNVLMIDPAWQRRGYGRLLVAESARRIKAQGKSSMLVAVEQHNPNHAFYEQLGVKQIGEKPFDWDGFQTKLILYRWEDLDERRFASS